MDSDYYHHPRRLPKNAAGPFYTTGYQTRETDATDGAFVWCGDCMQCEAPEAEAPELLAPLDGDNIDTYFLKQPSSQSEIAHACMAARVCCVSALRYGGRDQSIIQLLQNDPEMCDNIVGGDGQLVMTVDADGDLLPFAKHIVETHHEELRRKHQLRKKKWWQFWKS